MSGNRFLQVTEETESGMMLNHIQECSESKITAHEQNKLINNLVEQLFKGSLVNDGSWDSSNDVDKQNIKDMAKSIASHLRNI